MNCLGIVNKMNLMKGSKLLPNAFMVNSNLLYGRYEFKPSTLNAVLVLIVFLLSVQVPVALSDDLIVDNGDAGTSFTGTWSSYSGPERYGSGALWATAGGSVETYRFTPTIAVAGTYEVFAWNSCYGNRAINVPHVINHANGTDTIVVDQDCDTGTHGEWFSLGSYQFNQGSVGYLEISDNGLAPASTTYLGADAARFLSENNNTVPVLVSNVTALSLTDGEQASLTATASDAEDGDLTGFINWSDDASSETALGGSFIFTPAVGVHTVSLVVSDTEGRQTTATIVITVTASIGDLDNDNDGLNNDQEDAAGTGRDNPDSDADGLLDGEEVLTYNTNPLSIDTDIDDMDDKFEVDNNLNPLVNDSAEDPDGDNSSNLEEYQAGTDPNVANPAPSSDIIIDNGDTGTSFTGSWSNYTGPERYGSGALWATAGGSVETYRFTPVITEAGIYEVFAWNSCYGNRAINVPHTIQHANGTDTVIVDQDCDTGTHGEWFSLGSYTLQQGDTGYLEISDSGINSPSTTYIGADAARFVYVNTVTAPVARITSNSSSSIVLTDTIFSGATSQDYDGHLVRYSWNFGDGATSNEMDPSHQYVNQGTYTVTLEVEDNLGEIDQATTVIQILPAGPITAGRIAHYNFKEAQGTTILDLSGVGTPLNLAIPDESKVSWLACGGLSIDEATSIQAQGSASKLYNSIQGSNEITIEAWVNPDNLTQTGPARIVSFSSSSALRNFTLGQKVDTYEFRLRTSGTSDNGLYPHIRTSAGRVTEQLNHIVYTRNAQGDAKVYKDGVLIDEETIPGLINNWNEGYIFGLADEVTGGGSWLGDYFQVSLYNRSLIQDEVVHNYDLGVSNSCDNTSPVISSSPIITGAENTLYSYQVAATDSEGNVLTYALIDKPLTATIDENSGLINWAPDYSAAGTHAFIVAVSDASSTTTQSFNVVINNTNRAPIVNGQSLSLNEDSSLSITLSASDLDGDVPAFTSVSLPANGAVSGSAPNLVYTPIANFNGSDSFTFTVSDGLATSVATINLTVQAVNDAPELMSDAITSGIENTAYVYDVNATDADGDSITYSLTTAPTGMTINDTTGVVNWLPGYDAAGTHTVQISISDDQGSTISYSYSLNILNTNREPTVNSIELMSGAENTAYVYDVNATDPDDDSLTYILTTSADGMTIDAQSGLINWLPGFDAAGSHTVSVTVSDGQGADTVHSYVLTILNINRPPVINTTQLPVATQGLPYSVSIDANDPDGDALSFSLQNQPTTLTIDALSGEINWPIVDESVGSHSFTVTITDSHSAQTSLPINLLVEKQNSLPVVSSLPHTVAVVGKQYSYTINATDADDDTLIYSLDTAPGGLLITGNTLSWLPETSNVGQHNVSVSITDGHSTITHQYTLNAIAIDDSIPVYFGRDFWLPSAMQGSGSGQQSLMVYISSKVDTQGTITSHQPTSFEDMAFTVTANTVTAVDVRDGYTQLSHHSILNYAKHIQADDDITVYVVNYAEQNTDAMALIPEVLLGTEYRLSGYSSHPHGSGGYTFIATQDDTQITLTPRHDLKLTGSPYFVAAGDSYTVNLNQGNTYHVQSYLEQTVELTGSQVSSNKQIAVFINHGCTYVPYDAAFCDQLLEQLPPLNGWGTDYTLVPHYSRYKDLVRVLADHDQTEISLNGSITKILDSGEYWEYTLTQAQTLHASKPVLVTQFSAGDEFDSALRQQDANYQLTASVSHPIYSQVLQEDMATYLTEYTVTIDPETGSNAILLVSLGDNHDGLMIDGNPVDSNVFIDKDYCGQPCVNLGGSKYSIAQIALSPGTHLVQMPRPFGLYENVYGLSNFGDPFVSIVAPESLALKHYIFMTPEALYTRHFINITIDSDAIDSVVMNGKLIDSGFFKPVPNSTKSYAQLAINPGQHDIRADKPFNLLVYGYDQHDSYGYIGGFGAPSLAPIESINISLNNAQPYVGESMCARAQLLDVNQQPLNDVGISVGLSGRHEQQATIYSDIDGVAEYCFTGYITGTDTLTMYTPGFSQDVSVEWLTAQGENKVPVITSIPNLYVEVGSAYQYQVASHDPELSTTTYSLSSDAIGISIEANTGLIQWDTPLAGEYQTTVSVHDVEGLTATQNYSFIVNTPPHIISLPELSFNRNRTDKSYASPLEAADTDGDKLLYTLLQGGDDFTLMRASGYIGTDYRTPAGLYPMTVRIEDGRGASIETSFIIDLVDNHKPTIENTELDVSEYPGGQIDFQVLASDSDGDDLNFVLGSVYKNNVRLRNAQAVADLGFSFDANTGIAHWDLPLDESVEVRFNVTVQDVWNSGSFVTIYFRTQGYEGNIFSSTPVTTAFEGAPYQYAILAQNPANGVPATVTLINGPPEMTLDREGDYYYLNWLPDAGNCQHTVTLEMDDGINGPVQTQFTLDVYNAPKRMNRFQCSVDSEFCAAR